MPHFTINYLDHQGRVVGRFEFHCPNDSEAEQACEELPDPRPRELWCGSRWIGAWPAPITELRQA
jgi:hypothetical protein